MLKGGTQGKTRDEKPELQYKIPQKTKQQGGSEHRLCEDSSNNQIRIFNFQVKEIPFRSEDNLHLQAYKN